MLTDYSVNANIFVIQGWVGYFLLGLYLQQVNWRKKRISLLYVLGFVMMLAGIWLTTFPFNSLGKYNFFYDSLTINVIVMPIAIFMLLSKYPSDWPGNQRPRLKRLVQAISQNSLPIYLAQLIIMESLQDRFFGFRISLLVMNPSFEIPLLTVLTLFLTLGLVLLMKKIPHLKTWIG